MMPAEWAARLPDFSKPALSRRLRIDGREFLIQITPVRRGIDREPQTEVVQLQVLFEGQPLTPADLGLTNPACLNAWSYLCNKLTEAVVDFYGPRQRLVGEPNPRLGCWGPRPDRVVEGQAENDCGLAVVIGLATWTVGSHPLGTRANLIERLAEVVVSVLGYWSLVARQQAAR